MGYDNTALYHEVKVTAFEGGIAVANTLDIANGPTPNLKAVSNNGTLDWEVTNQYNHGLQIDNYFGDNYNRGYVSDMITISDNHIMLLSDYKGHNAKVDVYNKWGSRKFSYHLKLDATKYQQYFGNYPPTNPKIWTESLAMSESGNMLLVNRMPLLDNYFLTVLLKFGYVIPVDVKDFVATCRFCFLDIFRFEDIFEIEYRI